MFNVNIPSELCFDFWHPSTLCKTFVQHRPKWPLNISTDSLLLPCQYGPVHSIKLYLMCKWVDMAGVITLMTRSMVPTWGPSGTQVGPMLAPWTLLSGKIYCRNSILDNCRTVDVLHYHHITCIISIILLTSIYSKNLQCSAFTICYCGANGLCSETRICETKMVMHIYIMNILSDYTMSRDLIYVWK